MADPTDRLYTPAEAPQAPAPPIAPTGNISVDALTGVVNDSVLAFQDAPDPEQGRIGEISHHLNAALNAVDMPFQLLDTGLSVIASPLNRLMPGMPAAVISHPHLGTPHSHPHPPSMGVPLPSFGPTIASGCTSVLIGGRPAARAGDLGIAPTCGSFTPVFEIVTGSSNTFIGGSRAARMGIDLTRKCLPGLPLKKLADAGKQIKKAGKVRNAAEKVADGAGMAIDGAGLTAGAMSAAAEEASGDSSSALVTAAQTAADAAAMALSALMGKDPGAPPCVGAIVLGNQSVKIGGFPLPDAFALLASAASGLSKLSKRKRPDKASKQDGSKHPELKAQNAKCDRPGHPIDPVTGASANEFLDFEDRECLPFRWERYYYSAWNDRDGPLGFGFRHIFQRQLKLLRTRALFVDAELREYAFPRNEEGRYGGVFAGFELEQIDDCRFILRHETLGDMTFERRSAEGKTARLAGLVTKNDRSAFHYAGDGRLNRIVQVSKDGEAQRIETRFRYDACGHIVEVVRTAPMVLRRP